MTGFTEIPIFVRVVEKKSFTLAAKSLGITKSAVSKSVSRMEEMLRTKLLHRTTRHLSLTEAGTIFYEHCQRAVSEVEEAKRTIQKYAAIPSGLLKVTAPVSFGNLRLAPLIPGFLTEFKELRIDVVLTDREIDLAEGAFDVAVRLSETLDPGLVARKLGPIRRVLCASPKYLKKNSCPLDITELRKHQCISYSHAGAELTWRFRSGGRARSIRVQGRYLVNSSEAIREAVVQGYGIAILPDYIAAPDLESGRLIRILESVDAVTEFGEAVTAVYLPNRFLLPKVRVFIDYLAANLTSVSPTET